MPATNTTVDAHAGEIAAHAVTLTAATVDTVTFTTDFDHVEVCILVTGGAPTYFTVDGSTPTVGGKHCYVLPDAVGSYEVEVPTAGNTVVKLISAGTPTYSVTSNRPTG